MPDDPNLQLLEAAARALEPMLGEVVFVGGCVTGLLITDPAAAGIRPTMDVDVISRLAGRSASTGASSVWRVRFAHADARLLPAAHDARHGRRALVTGHTESHAGHGLAHIVWREAPEDVGRGETPRRRSGTQGEELCSRSAGPVRILQQPELPHPQVGITLYLALVSARDLDLDHEIGCVRVEERIGRFFSLRQRGAVGSPT